MKPSLLQRMDIWVRHMVPIGSSLFLVLLTATPSKIPNFSVIEPMVSLMCVFYWSLYRPDLVSIHVTFVLGLLVDFLGMFPLGSHSLLFLLAHSVTVSMRHFLLEASPMMMWFVFSIIAAGTYVLLWVIITLFYGPSPIKTVFFSYIMTVSIYPVINRFLARLQVALLRDA